MKVVVLGGGITGLSTAFHIQEHARRTGAAIDLVVLEREGGAGGHVQTIRDMDFVVETGPNGFLDREREPQTRDLVHQLGLGPHLRESRPAARRRFVFHRGRLRLVPTSPQSVLWSDALSMRARLRLLLEPWARSAPHGVDESVFDFARRRLGPEPAEVLVDTAVSGISAGDSRRLSLASAFPLMLEMERESGGLIRAMIARRRQRPARLVTLEGGMQTLIDELGVRLGERLRTGCAVSTIARTANQWSLGLVNGERLEADRLVLAIPAVRAATLVGAFDPALAGALSAIPFAGLAMVALAFRQADTGPLDGYGYLIPRNEDFDTLGVVWESSLFEGRAPRGMVLLRAMLGGARRPDVVERSEIALIECARREIASVMGVSSAPARTWVRRFPSAIAQYELGHAARVERARSLAAGHPHLVLCGTSYDGVSFTSAVASAVSAARTIVRGPIPAAIGHSLEDAPRTASFNRASA